MKTCALTAVESGRVRLSSPIDSLVTVSLNPLLGPLFHRALWRYWIVFILSSVVFYIMGTPRHLRSNGQRASGSLTDKVLRQCEGLIEGLSDDVQDGVLASLNPKSSSKTKKGSNDCDAIAAKVAEILLPLLTSQIERIVHKCIQSTVTAVTSVFEEENNKTLAKLEQTNFMLRYEVDKLEQYSRRETVKITGLPESDDENVDEKVLALCSALSCDIKINDISVAHRNGKKVRGKPRPVLVKFTSRRSKGALMKKRKDLKDKQGYRDVFINDDLTPMRSKLLFDCKKLSNVQRVTTTHDGRIQCQLKSPAGSEPGKVVYVENPDDLFELGVDSVDYSRYGLQHYTTTAPNGLE